MFIILLYCINKDFMGFLLEFVIKVRVANSEERDFIEVEIDKECLFFEKFLIVCC